MDLFKDEKEPRYRTSNPTVHCDVKNCVYHDGDQSCSANAITVGPTYAVSSTDTACATFKQKNI